MSDASKGVAVRPGRLHRGTVKPAEKSPHPDTVILNGLADLLVLQDATVHIASMADEHGPILSAWFLADHSPGKSRRRRATRVPRCLVSADVRGLLAGLTGVLPLKQCVTCKAELCLDAFSKDLSQLDGRSPACKVCERKRVVAYGRRMAEAKKARAE